MEVRSVRAEADLKPGPPDSLLEGPFVFLDLPVVAETLLSFSGVSYISSEEEKEKSISVVAASELEGA